MSSVNIWYAVAAFACFYYIVKRTQGHFRERQFRRFARSHGAEFPTELPHRLPWAIDGVFRVIMAATGKEDMFDDIFVPRHRQYGRTFMSTGLGGVQNINTCEPKNIQAILGTQFEDFYMGTTRMAQFGVLLGKSIFNIDGPAWAHARALFRPMFSRSNINDLEETERAVKIFLDVLPKESESWTSTFDIQPLFYRFTM
jgi:cytochrome P450